MTFNALFGDTAVRHLQSRSVTSDLSRAGAYDKVTSYKADQALGSVGRIRHWFGVVPASDFVIRARCGLRTYLLESPVSDTTYE